MLRQETIQPKRNLCHSQDNLLTKPTDQALLELKNKLLIHHFILEINIQRAVITFRTFIKDI